MFERTLQSLQDYLNNTIEKLFISNVIIIFRLIIQELIGR